MTLKNVFEVSRRPFVILRNVYAILGSFFVISRKAFVISGRNAGEGAAGLSNSFRVSVGGFVILGRSVAVLGKASRAGSAVGLTYHGGSQLLPGMTSAK
jgi:hypothetical protein